jgi:hypothetical protein
VVGSSQFGQTIGVVRRQADLSAAQGMWFGSMPSQAKPDQVCGAAVQSSGSSTARRCHFLQYAFHGQKREKPLHEEEVIAVPGRADLPFPVEQGDLHALPGQPVLLEERAQVALPLLTPMVDHHPPRPKLQQVQPASPHDEPDHPLRIGGIEHHQPLTGTFEDRLAGVFQAPGHGIINGPGFPAGSVQEPERVPPCEQEPRQEQGCDCGQSGLEKGASGRERLGVLRAAQGLQVEGGTEPPSSSQPDGCRFFDHGAAGQPVGGPRRGRSLGPSG